MAIRTWAVGRLQNQGMRWRDAMRLVSEETGLPEVSQSKYQLDKQRLIERVPEARHHLEYRARRVDKACNPSETALG